MKTARDYVEEMLFLTNRRLGELERAGGEVAEGRRVAYQETAALLQQIIDFTNPDL